MGSFICMKFEFFSNRVVEVETIKCYDLFVFLGNEINKKYQKFLEAKLLAELSWVTIIKFHIFGNKTNHSRACLQPYWNWRNSLCNILVHILQMKFNEKLFYSAPVTLLV